MKSRRAFLILVLVVVVLFVPVIPAYRIGGPIGGLGVGFGRGECEGQMLVSLLYLLTGLGPNIVLNLPASCFLPT